MWVKFCLTSEEILLDSLWLRELRPSLRLYKNEVANPQGRTSADTAWPQSSDYLQLETELSSSHGITGTRAIHPQKRQRFPTQLSHVSKTCGGLCLIPADLQPNVNVTPITPEERTYWFLHLGLWSVGNPKTFKSPEHWSHPFISVWFVCYQSTWKVGPNQGRSIVKIMIFEIKPLMPHFISATDFNIFERWDYIKCLPFNFVQSSSKIMVVEKVLYYIGPIPILVI